MLDNKGATLVVGGGWWKEAQGRSLMCWTVHLPFVQYLHTDFLRLEQSFLRLVHSRFPNLRKQPQWDHGNTSAALSLASLLSWIHSTALHTNGRGNTRTNAAHACQLCRVRVATEEGDWLGKKVALETWLVWVFGCGIGWRVGEVWGGGRVEQKHKGDWGRVEVIVNAWDLGCTRVTNRYCGKRGKWLGCKRDIVN